MSTVRVPFDGFESPPCTSLQVFTGQVPFVEYKASAMVMKMIIDGKRPQKPSKVKKLGLSDEFWEIIQSSLVREVEKRPPVGRFIEFLKKATPEIAVLEGLAEFDANSEGDVQKLRHMFGYGDNALLGMREDETLALIEVLDRVGLPVQHSAPSLNPELFWFQVLNSSLNDGDLRSRCLRGLQKVSARCGLLPKSYWITHSDLTQPEGTASITGRVSNTCQRSIDGQLVAVKTIGLDCITDFRVFKHVRPSPLPKRPLSTSRSTWARTATVHQRDHVETTTTSECCQFPWVWVRFPSFLPCIPLDVQRQPVRLLAQAS